MTIVVLAVALYCACVVAVLQALMLRRLRRHLLVSRLAALQLARTLHATRNTDNHFVMPSTN